MLMRLLVSALAMAGHYSLFSQTDFSKPSIDSSVYAKWPYVDAPALSSNGRYALFTIVNQPIGQKTLIIKSTDLKWEKQFILTSAFQSAKFASDSKTCILKISDTVYLVGLGNNSLEVIPGVQFYDVSTGERGHWLVYQVKNEEGRLVVRNLKNNSEKYFSHVKSFQITEVKNIVVFETVKDNGIELAYYDPEKDICKTVWQGESPEFLISDRFDEQITFLVNPQKQGGGIHNQVWYYKFGEPAAIMLVSRDDADELDKASYVSRIAGFNTKGTHIFFTIKRAEPSKENPDAVPLNIWHYKDVKLHPAQSVNEREYFASIAIDQHKLVRLERENESILWPANSNVYNDEYVCSNLNNGGDASEFWMPGSTNERWIISTNDAASVRMPIGGFGLGEVSPANKYYVYYELNEKSYFSYEIATGITRNITTSINTTWTNMLASRDKRGEPLGVAGWLVNDEAVLLHDEYDIWQVDPLGKRKPIQLTNGIGKKEKIFFERISERPPLVKSGEEVFITSFSRASKVNGVYIIEIGKQADPIHVSSGDYLYYTRIGAVRSYDGSSIEPIKAKNGRGYVIRRMTAAKSPNYYYTQDFKSFTALSNLHPEKEYNWYTTELHKWKSPMGRDLQGILYKPENFDSTKKYPIIFWIYEHRSDDLNVCIQPAPSDGQVNLPWYVSNGYLVFVPDILYTMGEPFKSTHDCVMSAVNLLSRLPFVDSTKMGLQGLSWGGIQTNYLVTHTNVFAAVCSSSSKSDWVSAYNGLIHGNNSGQVGFETGQERVGFTLWENPDWYIESSPIMHADKVTSPFLMMQTTLDEATRIDQAIEMFNALRRLRKRVWLLEYTDSNHGVWGKSGYDFDLRMQQFFNHYLKGYPAPKWMTQGRSAKLKNIDSCLTIDSVNIP